MTEDRSVTRTGEGPAALLLALVNKERVAIYAVENQQMTCTSCNNMTRSFRRLRLAELDAAADWLAPSVDSSDTE